MSKLFEIKEITKFFGEKSNRFKALDGITMDIDRGEFVAIIGPSGSGKSTFLNIISGLDRNFEGVVCLKDQDLSKMSKAQLSDLRRDEIGFVFQAYNLIPVLNVEENIEYIMLLRGVSPNERRERVVKVLEQLGISGLEKRLPSELSGGQQQRVAIARAIVSRPSIVFADEPTANLDSKTGADLIELMAKLNEEENITFIFSTHDPKIMAKAKRIVTLEDGRIISEESSL